MQYYNIQHSYISYDEITDTPQSKVSKLRCSFFHHFLTLLIEVVMGLNVLQ